MNNDKLVCPICGEPTRIYMGKARKDRLCGKHADMLKAGNLNLDNTGKYVFTNNAIEQSTLKESTCIICGKSTENGWQYLCSDCYSTCLDYTKEMNKNYSIPEYRNYYYNAKSNIYTLTGFEKFIKPNCLALTPSAPKS